MTEIRADDATREFMRRTLANLALVHEKRQPNGPYEVTQLINSFLGAMVHPWEEMRDREIRPLGSLSVKEARLMRLPVLDTDLETSDEPRNYREMFRFIRNAFAHGNLAFDNVDGEISGVYLENLGTPYWRGRASIKNLNDLLQVFDDIAHERLQLPYPAYRSLISYAAD